MKKITYAFAVSVITAASLSATDPISEVNNAAKPVQTTGYNTTEPTVENIESNIPPRVDATVPGPVSVTVGSNTGGVVDFVNTNNPLKPTNPIVP